VRHEIGLLGTVTSVLLAAAVVTAAPAEARRNVGGLVEQICLTSGHAKVKIDGPGLGASCVCIIQEFETGTVVVDGPNGKCPPGILRLQDRKG
jgi:hypothetical protein